MNKHWQIKNNKKAILKFSAIALWMMLFLWGAVDSAVGQVKVTVTTDTNGNIQVTIENKTNEEIVFFPKTNMKKFADYDNKGKDVRSCGIDKYCIAPSNTIDNNPQPLLKGKTVILQGKSLSLPKGKIKNFNYYIVKSIDEKGVRELDELPRTVPYTDPSASNSPTNAASNADPAQGNVNANTPAPTTANVPEPAPTTANVPEPVTTNANAPTTVILQTDAKLYPHNKIKNSYKPNEPILITYKFDGESVVFNWAGPHPSGITKVPKNPITKGTLLEIQGAISKVGNYSYVITIKGKNETFTIRETIRVVSADAKKTAEQPAKSYEEEYNDGLQKLMQAEDKAESSEQLKKILKDAKALEQKIDNEIKHLKGSEYANSDYLIDNYTKILEQVKKLKSVIQGKAIPIIAAKYDEQILSTTDKDSTELNAIKAQIGEMYVTKWTGKDRLKTDLDTLAEKYNLIKKESERFIDNELKKEGNAEFSDIIKDLESRIPNFYEEIKIQQNILTQKTLPIAMLSLIAIALLLLVFGLVFYTRIILQNKKLEQIKKEKQSSGESGLVIIEEAVDYVAPSYVVGLSEVKAKVGSDYYKIEMKSISEDSGIQNVYISRKCILDIYKFFSDFLKYEQKTDETGCFLVGLWEYIPDTQQQVYNISIEELVEPSDDAVYGEYNLNFGAEIGISLNDIIEKLREKTGNEYVHTAWMHSHPGMGLFLSAQDLNVQSQLAYSSHRNRMLAIVLDSNTPDLKMAFFAPQKEGGMNNDKDLKQTISLETLYQWAKTPVRVQKSSAVGQNYFSVKLLSANSKINEILFSGSAIIDMDTTLMPDVSGLQGYFYGTEYSNEISFDDFLESEKEVTKPLGCLLVVQYFDCRQIQIEHASLLERFDCAVVYCTETGNIHLLAKDEQKQYPNTEAQIAFASLMKMKEWTRRRR